MMIAPAGATSGAAPGARRCPRCTFSLVPHHHGAAEIDVCPRCHGSWLDAGEAKMVLGENAEPSTWERTAAARHLGRAKVSCPDGHGVLSAYRVQAPPDSGVDVEVDVCPHCMGLWLDAWEATRLQQATRQLAASLGAVPADKAKTGVGWYLFQLFTGMPVEEYNPVRKKPVIVWTILAACVAVFVVELAYLGQGDPIGEWFIKTYGLVPKDLLAGRNVHSVITHMFMHGGLAHLLGNMYFLYVFGDNIEERVGRLRFTVLYLAFGLAAMAAQVAFTLGSEQPLVGASGAISGLMGAYLALFPKTRVYVVWFFIRFKLPTWVYLGLWMLLQAALGFYSLTQKDGPGVAWWAHLGGFLAGALWGSLARGKYADGAELRRR